MTNGLTIAGGALIAAAATCCAPALAQVPPSVRLAATVDVFGARIGMTRAALLAHTPATTIRGARCTTPLSDDPKLLFLECGLHKLTVDFTAAGKVWQLRASYDFTATPLAIEDARSALVARYGKPTVNVAGALTWLPPGTPAAKSDLCAGSAMLLSAAIELRGTPAAPATSLPSIDPGCLPIRTAILAGHAGHRGVIVEVQDARARLAELAPSPGNAAPKRR